MKRNVRFVYRFDCENEDKVRVENKNNDDDEDDITDHT